MRNITLAIDDKTYNQVRVWCALRDISISHAVRMILNDLPRLEKSLHLPLPEEPEDDSDELGSLEMEFLRRYRDQKLSPGA